MTDPADKANPHQFLIVKIMVPDYAHVNLDCCMTALNFT